MTVSSPIKNISSETLPPANAVALLDPDALESLLHHLIGMKWRRLQPEYDDPIKMLMNQGTKQWTAGWAPRGNTLYLLTWESDSFEERAWWRFFENGALVFEEMDGQSKTRSALFNRLLESDELPFISHSQWFEPMLHYNHPAEWRYAAVQALLNSLMVRPEMLNTLKDSLFKALEFDLSNPQWPLLEVLKLHRLAHKSPLVWLFQQLVQMGFIRTLQDNARLDRALTLLQNDYAYFSVQVAPIFKSLFDQAYEEFRQLMTQGTWRTGLRLRVPLHN
jgi:hypothetical protein